MIEDYSKPSCPPTYLLPSILISLLAFLPIGIAAIIFASQVESKYHQGDYDGAESASNTAKILCIVGAGLSVPFYLLFIALFSSVIFDSSFQMAHKAKEAEAKNNIGVLNRSQQAYYLEKEKFANTISDLAIGFLPESENYKYEINADATKVISTATAKIGHVKSYTGAVFTIKTKVAGVDQMSTVAKACESDQPSNIPPKMPELVGREISCATGSSELYKYKPAQ